MMENETVSITCITKGKVPSLPFSVVKNAILGKSYELSLVFADKKTAQNLNIEHRNKDYVPNVLSFPYTKNSGEIFLHLPTAKIQAPDFKMEYVEYVLFLFIHGCLHLKGMEHSSTMEKRERTLLKKFWTTPQVKNNYARQIKQTRI